MVEPAMCAAIGHEFQTPENNIAPGVVLGGLTQDIAKLSSKIKEGCGAPR